MTPAPGPTDPAPAAPGPTDPASAAAPGSAGPAGADASAPDALTADYRSAGFGHALQPGSRPALLLVDPVRAYTEPACPLYAGTSAVAAAGAMADLLAAARRAGIPVVVTRVLFRPDGLDGGVFWRKVPALSVYVEGGPYARIVEGLEPADGEVLVTKQYPSAFFATPLAAMLTALRVDTLLIGGYSTSGCVRASTLDAMQHGFVPLVVEDAVADRDPAVHSANLFDIRHKMAEVWSLNRAVTWLASTSAV